MTKISFPEFMREYVVIKGNNGINYKFKPEDISYACLIEDSIKNGKILVLNKNRK